MAASWRLLLDGAAAGSWNMGVDEALLGSAARDAVPTLRFYTWDAPCLSLGYAQRLCEARRRACHAARVPVVRRATGGRAVLHGSDLTYAVAAPEAYLPAGLRASYAVVSEGLCAALRALGVPAQRRAGRPAERSAAPFDCFALAATDEICVAGHKLVGSAQRRCGGAVLQHGSIRLRPDDPRAARAAGQRPGAATSLHELGLAASLEAVRDACVEQLGNVLVAAFERGALAAEELRRARQAAHRLSGGALRVVGEPPRESQEGLSATDR
jgi:lipoyl(octanoyl) transferase